MLSSVTLIVISLDVLTGRAPLADDFIEANLKPHELRDR